MDTIHLLLVDDEADFRAATSQVLSRRGFVVDQAASGEEALAMLARTDPDVVLLDLRMDGMSGIETLEKIREIDADVPVIILTGHGGLDEAISGISLSIVDFIQKPVDIGKLASRIRHLLAHEEAGTPLRERTIAELMVPLLSYHRIYVDQPLREVVTELRDSFFQEVVGKVTEQGHRSVLVYDRSDRYVGILRVFDIISAVIPPYLRDSPYASFFTGMFLAQTKVLGSRGVAALLTSGPTIDINVSLMEAVHVMSKQRVINLPVTRDGEVVGILRDKDLLLEIAENM